MTPHILVICLTILFVACSNESFEEIVPDAVENPDPDPDPDPDPEPDPDLVTDPCDFDISSIKANTTTVINCQLDLQGKSVDLPANVNFDFDGGLIINGTLNFSGGYIDGRIMNSDLELKGDVQLKDPIFKFIPSRWKNIVQGRVSTDVALSNNANFEGLINQTKALGATTFEVDQFDAYFEVATVTSTTTNQNFYPSREAINVPSDFTLRMTDNTNLRVQPNSRKNYVLLAVRDASNVRVEGGNLIGDRLEHDDNSQPGPHAFGFVLMIHGGSNVDLVGVRTILGTGDGIDVNSIGFTFEAGYIPSNNIRITNCIMDSNRRNNMSITDGFNIVVDGCQFLNAGIDMPGSPGMAPGVAMDVEAFRGKDDAGNFILYERAYDLTFRNNFEKGSKFGSFVVAIGEDVTIENNTTEDGIAIGAGHGIKIIGNTLIAAADDNIGAGITTGHPNSTDTYDNVIANNRIIGHNIGIAAYQRDMKIYGNVIEDFGVGIQPKDIRNFEIYDNTLTSDRDASIAIFGNLTTMDNVTFRNNNVVRVARESVKMVAVNENAGQESFKTTFSDNDFTGSTTISRTSGVDFMENRTKKGIILVNAKNIDITGNTIESTGQDGITIQQGCSNLNIGNNNITVIGTNLDCIDQKAAGTNIVIANTNTCTN